MKSVTNPYFFGKTKPHSASEVGIHRVTTVSMQQRASLEQKAVVVLWGGKWICWEPGAPSMWCSSAAVPEQLPRVVVNWACKLSF